MLKILQARLQQYMNQELQMFKLDLFTYFLFFLIFYFFKLDLEKTEEPEIKLPTTIGSSNKQQFQKNIDFCFIDYVKALDYVEHNKLWKILQEMGIPAHLTVYLEISVSRSGSNN